MYFVHRKTIVNGKERDDSFEKHGMKEVVKVRELVRTNKRWEPRFRSKEIRGDTREEK